MIFSGSNRPFSSSLLFLPLLLSATAALAGASSHAPPSWQPVELSPAPRIEPAGVVVLPCSFTPQNDRCVWDGPPPPAFDPASRLELTLSCDKPELLRGMTVYLRSGPGWYVAALPSPDILPRPVSLTPVNFSNEGRPAGWGQIDAVRLAAWKRAEGECVVRLAALASIQDRVFVIRADDSAPAGEKIIADTLAARASDWLSKAGIGHALIAESEWIQLPPAQTRFALLPYNPRPHAPFINALAAVIKKGGKLLVCYSASPELANRMGFRLSPYLAAPTPVYWSAFRFAPPVGPVTRVFQESPNLIPAYPDSPKAAVLAWWESAAGERRQEPAWLGSPAGYWMTHILEPEDAAVKTRLLLEWIGSAAPEAWEQAGQAALSRAEAVMAPGELKPLRLLASRKEWNQLIDESGRLRNAQALQKASSLPPAPTSETAAVWIQPGAGRMPSDWPQVAESLKKAGIRRVYLSAVAFGRAHGESSVWPRSEMAGFVSDPFGAALKAARQSGLSVHAWITCFNVAYTPAPRLAAWRMAGRLMQTPSGEQPWLTPTHPENRALLIDGITQFATRYPVDGIQLDYVRFPDNALDISPSAIKGFEAATGTKLEHGASDVLPGARRHEAYKQWLIDTLTAFVKEVRARVHAIRPSMTVSAAVFPAYPYCRDGVLQDWKTWLETDSIDAVCPMSYTTNLREFRSFIEAYKTMPGWGSRIFPGIGIYSDSAALDPLSVVDQIRAIREAGGAGAVFFIANREFLRDYPAVLQPALD